jgi:tetratricopeptide (TPR) repeat protein
MDDPSDLDHADDSITLLGRAIDHFTDRRAAIRRYASLLNDDPPGNAVVYFHGDGGNGKSLLLRFLRARCSQRLTPDNWRYLKRLRDDEAFVANLTEALDARIVPTAATDFERGTEDILGRLRDLRTDLARSGFRFPHFDYACIDYWQANGVKSEAEIKALFPTEELDFVAAALGFAGAVAPYGQLVAGIATLFNRHFGGQVTRGRYRRGLDEDLFRDMQRWDRRTELLDHLPRYFAADLNAQMRDRRQDERVALFFDGHERFWGSVRNVVPAENPERDRWLRSLLNRLDLTAGIVAVVAGREVPPWQPGTDAVHFTLDLLPVEEFTDADALDYLQKIEEVSPDLHGALLGLGRVGAGPDHIHPLYLGLAVDVVLAAARRGVRLTPDAIAPGLIRADKPRELVRRLWQYVDPESRDSIRALSACRSFDWPVYRRLDQALGLGASQARFRVLTAFSFVRPVPGTERPTYRVHALMRQLLREEPLPILRAAHEELEGYYRERDDPAARAEAIYHANRRDWQRGVEEWVERFKDALWRNRYDECHALVDVRDELVVEGSLWAGRIATAIGQFATLLARHGEAEAAFRDALAAHAEAIRHDADAFGALRSMAVTQRLLGALLATQAKHGEAEAAFWESIVACGEALRLAPEDLDAHNTKGNVFRSLGNLLATQAKHGEAEASYREGIAAFDQALRLAPDYLNAHNNKGLALELLGNLLAAQAKHGEAEAAYREGIAAFDQALRLAPDAGFPHNNKGNALNSLGNLLAAQARHGEAETAFRGSIVVCGEALRLAPDDTYAHNNKGIALESLGNLLATQAKHGEAETAYREGIAALDQALRLAPDYINAHNNKGNAFSRLGTLLAEQARHGEAEAANQEGIAALDRALRLAPNDPVLLNNMGEALRRLGRLLTEQARHGEAEATYQQSIATYDEALRLAPDLIEALGGHGETSDLLGVLALEVGGKENRDDACRHFDAASASLRRAVRIAPDRADVHEALERVHGHLAELGCDVTEDSA